LISRPEVGVTNGTFTVVRGQRVSPLPASFSRTIPKSQANNASGLTLQGDPGPDFLLLVVDKRPQLIDLQDRPLRKGTNDLGNRLCPLYLTLSIIWI
jgi:hypothetical protein